MRIALIAHTNAAWTYPYSRHLLRRGHDVLVLSFSPDPIEGIPVAYLDRDAGWRLPGPLRFLSRVPRARAILREHAPDVVLATYLSSNGMTAALSWRGPMVVSARGGDVLKQDGYLPGGRLHGPMMRFVCRRAAFVHTVSEELSAALIACGIPSAKIACFPVGVDLSRFAPAPAAAREADAGPPRIICTRRQEPVYGNETLIDALALLKDAGVSCRCTLIGGGPQLEERRAQAAGLGISDRVEFAGEVAHDRLSGVLSAAQIYVSASWSDGTSSSLLEAMASGLFPVVSRIRANLKWIDDGSTGLFFEAGDPVSLSAALRRAIEDPALRASAAAGNRALVEREGNLVANMDRLEELLRRAVETHPRGR